jgi:hypothetical protein
VRETELIVFAAAYLDLARRLGSPLATPNDRPVHAAASSRVKLAEPS